MAIMSFVKIEQTLCVTSAVIGKGPQIFRSHRPIQSPFTTHKRMLSGSSPAPQGIITCMSMNNNYQAFCLKKKKNSKASTAIILLLNFFLILAIKSDPLNTVTGFTLYHILSSVSAPIQLFWTWQDGCMEQGWYRPEGEITPCFALLLRGGIAPKFRKQFIE
jgi:hypothetical protein